MTKFLYILIFISNLGIAQISFSHYINETSVWRYEAHRYLTQSGCGGMCGINSTAYVTEYIDGTSNINGYTYYKLYAISNRFGIISPVYGPIYIREGSNGKFYFLNSPNDVETEYFDNNSIQNIQNGSLIDNYGNINPPTLCTADVSYITIGGLSLKKVKSVGYKIEGIATSRHLNGVLGGGICSGVTSTIQQNGTLRIHDYDLLFSYTKNGSTYVESSTGGNISNYPVPTYLNTTSYNIDETKIFPNPTSDVINIQSNSKVGLIEVFDAQGRKLENIILNDFEIKFDFSNYQKGTYFIKFITDLGIVTKKIIKE